MPVLRWCRLLRPWFLPLCCSLMIASRLAAQAQTGVIEGRAADTSGGVIADASVVLRNVDTNQTRRAVTDRNGMFRIADIPVGTYDVRVDFAGFAPGLQTRLTLGIGQTARLAIVLQPSGVVESAAVSAQPPPLDVGQTSVSTAVDTERIEELPVRSRNYLEFVLLAPGVSRTPPARQTTSTGSSSLPDSGFSFGGLRPRSNTLTIDGLDNNDEFAGSSRTELSLETVREFQVLSNGWSAENGGASGGAINVVTKSGANAIHGDAFLFAQSGVFNARPKLEDTGGQAPRLRRYRGGMAVGGPLVKDRTFYYAAAEREHAQGQAASDIDPDAARAINTVLGAGLFPQVATRRLTASLFPTAHSETEWSAKVTHELPGRGALGARVAGTDRRDGDDAFNTDALSDPSARGTTTMRDRAITSALTTTVGARTTNDLRVQLASRRLASRTAEQQGAGVVISGVAAFGTPYAGNNTHDQTYVDAGDTVGHSRGSHFVKVGATVRHVDVTGTTADGVRGVYLFRTLERFLAANADQTRMTSSGADVDLALTRASAFVQDHWTPTPRLTVDAGLRVDASVLPPSFGITSRAFNPRLGFAWMPVEKWIVRGGAGVFADRLVLAALERGWLGEQRHVTEVVADPGSAAAPSTYTVRHSRWNPASRQASIGLERQLTSKLTASINYLLVRGRGLSRTV